MATKKFDYLIVGNSAGGIGCVEGIRRAGQKGSIAVVSDEDCHTYARPLITHLIEGDVEMKGMDFRPRNFYGSFGVEPFLGYRAEGLDLEKRSVRLRPTNGGTRHTLRFDRLLIATGGKPFIPPMAGLDLDGVTPMITLKQSLDVRGRLGRVRRAVVLGAGLIGTKTAEALAHRVESVSMVELADRILSPVTDPVSSAMATESFRNNGVEVLLNTTIEEVRGDARGRVKEVKLKDGSVLPCDLLVIAIGVRPRTELAEEGGVALVSMKLGGGIEVDVKMRTSAEGVYACGDCAHAHDFVTGGMRLLPLWPNAYIGGRIAGLNMAGAEHSHRWATNMNSVDFFGFPMVSAGFTLKPEKKGYEEIVRHEGGQYAKIVLKDDVIQGLIMAGHVDRAGIYLGLMREKVKTTSFKEQLLTDEFAVVHLPAEVKERIKQPITEIE
ncbi:MAG: FAD-dependent oxidoreductase [bacterium]|nr:MAG: FAD-dependent oxidoreductase [bacterium]